MSRGAMIGRFPIRRVGDYVCFLDRSARNVFVHNSTKEEKFKRVYNIKVSSKEDRTAHCCDIGILWFVIFLENHLTYSC